MRYKDPHGVKRVMKRVERGKPARMLPRPAGAKVWLARTAATPDVWAILKPKEKKK
jgi:2-keto-4-pentenoate hydratase